MTTWTKQKISQVASEKRQAYMPSSQEHLPCLELEHIEQQSLRLSSIGDSADTASQKKKFKSGDVLYGSLRPYFRKVYRPKFDGVCSSDITVLSVNRNSDAGYLFYLIASSDFIGKASSASNGTKMPRAGWNIVKDFEFIIPDLPTQARIASVLSAYDDLIENNERRIKALEEMAQLLYIEWFVKFKFPGHEKVKMVDSKTEYGMVPEGWEVVTIESLLGKVKRKIKIQVTEYLTFGKFPIVDQGREFIAGYTNDEATVYDEDLIVFGDHSRCFKYCNFPFACGADGTQLLLINDSERMPETLLYYIVLNCGLQNFNYARHFKFLKSLRVIKPDSFTAQKFATFADGAYSQIRVLRDKNKNLSQTRDLLIPQLVTGRRGLKET